MEKPHGLTLILPEDAVGILASLPVEKFHGVGKKTVERLHEMGVYTGQDLLDVPEMVLIDRFGRFGFDLYRKARAFLIRPLKWTVFVSQLERKGPIANFFIGRRMS